MASTSVKLRYAAFAFTLVNSVVHRKRCIHTALRPICQTFILQVFTFLLYLPNLKFLSYLAIPLVPRCLPFFLESHLHFHSLACCPEILSLLLCLQSVHMRIVMLRSLVCDFYPYNIFSNIMVSEAYVGA